MKTQREVYIDLVKISVVTGTNRKGGNIYINPNHLCLQIDGDKLTIHNGYNLYVDPDFAKNYDEFYEQMMKQGVRLPIHKG